MGASVRAARTRSTLPPAVGYFCGHCAGGQHRSCPGVTASGLNARNAATACACHEDGHRPDDRLAAWMRLSRRPDLAGDTVEHLAAEWRDRHSLVG